MNKRDRPLLWTGIGLVAWMIVGLVFILINLLRIAGIGMGT